VPIPLDLLSDLLSGFAGRSRIWDAGGSIIAVPRNHCCQVAFSQEKATSHDICKGIRIVEPLYFLRSFAASIRRRYGQPKSAILKSYGLTSYQLFHSNVPQMADFKHGLLNLV
jgi:hypothetical protein